MRSVLFAFCFLLSCTVFAQIDSTALQEPNNNLEVSILTCGVGSDLYASFGHIGIRVRNQEFGTDEVYNYGTFDYSDPDFYIKFTRGKLLYFISKSSFSDFMEEYKEEKRSVVEQVLNLKADKELAIVAFLENNLKPQNRAYHYDFLFDNCATRIRDIFPEVLGKEFYWGDVLNSKSVSFRTVINQYLINKHWERLGIDLLLGSPVDKLMTDESSMFLPDFLHKGLKGAIYNNQKLVTNENTLLQSRPFCPKNIGWAIVDDDWHFNLNYFIFSCCSLPIFKTNYTVFVAFYNWIFRIFHVVYVVVYQSPSLCG